MMGKGPGSKHRKPGGSRPAGGGGRRTPPSESTGREARWLRETKERNVPVVVRLLAGEELRGVIEYYDRDMIKINRPDGPSVFVRKRDIRYLHRDPDGIVPPPRD